MNQYLVCYSASAVTDSCPVCGEEATSPAGAQLVLGSQPVCRACGQRHAPALAALLGLADEAVRVGRIGRHTVVPPYTALLDLARAADDYSACVGPAGRAE